MKKNIKVFNEAYEPTSLGKGQEEIDLQHPNYLSLIKDSNMNWIEMSLTNLSLGKKVFFTTQGNEITHPNVLVQMLLKKQNNGKLYYKDYNVGDKELCARCTFSKTTFKGISFYIPINDKKSLSLFTHKDQVVTECVMGENGKFKPLLVKNQKNSFRNILAMDFDLKAELFDDWLISDNNKYVQELLSSDGYDDTPIMGFKRAPVSCLMYNDSYVLSKDLDFRDDYQYVVSRYKEYLESVKEIQENKIQELIKLIGIPKGIIKNKKIRNMNRNDMWKFIDNGQFKEPKLFGFHIFWELDQLLSNDRNLNYRHYSKRLAKLLECDEAFNHDIMKNVYSSAFEVQTFDDNDKISLKDLYKNILVKNNKMTERDYLEFFGEIKTASSDEIIRANDLISKFDELNHYTLSKENQQLRDNAEKAYYSNKITENGDKFSCVALSTRNNSVYAYLTRLNKSELNKATLNNTPKFVFSNVEDFSEEFDEEEFQTVLYSVNKARNNYNVPDSISLDQFNKNGKTIDLKQENIECTEFVDKWHNISSERIMKHLEVKTDKINKDFVVENFNKLYFSSNNKSDFNMTFKKFKGIRIDGSEGIYTKLRTHKIDGKVNLSTPLDKMKLFVRNLGLQYVISNLPNFASDEFMEFANKFIFTKIVSLNSQATALVYDHMNYAKYDKDKIVNILNIAISCIFFEEKEIYNSINKYDKQTTLEGDPIAQMINNGDKVNYLDLYIKLIEINNNISEKILWDNGKPKNNKLIIKTLGSEYHKTDKLLKEIKEYWANLYNQYQGKLTIEYILSLIEDKSDRRMKSINTTSSEDLKINENSFTENEIINSFIDLGKMIGIKHLIDKNSSSVPLLNVYLDYIKSIIDKVGNYFCYIKYRDFITI